MSILIRDTLLTALMVTSIVASLYIQYFASIELYGYLQLVWFLALVMSIIYIRYSTSGKHFVQYVKDAKSEISKVVWPEKDDVVRTTIAVGIAVVIFSFIISFLDSLMVKFVGLITG